MVEPPNDEPPPEQAPPPRRPLYHPAGFGCLFWALLLILVWFVIGLFWAPAWWPWWW